MNPENFMIKNSFSYVKKFSITTSIVGKTPTTDIFLLIIVESNHTGGDITNLHLIIFKLGSLFDLNFTK